MSENIEFGIVCNEWIPLETMFTTFEIMKNHFNSFEIYSISDWMWNNLKKIKSVSLKNIENTIVVYKNPDPETNIGAYQYKIDELYVTEIWTSSKLFDHNKKQINEYIKSVETYLSCIKDEICLLYAYIGFETYIKHSKNYETLQNSSKGVIKWIFK